MVGIPLYTFSNHKGMAEGPRALRKAGLASRLGGPADLGDVKLQVLKRDVQEGSTKNFAHFRDSTIRIYQATKSVTAERVFVLGGECSLSPGCLAGLSEVFEGKPGMLWLDAHGDFNTPGTTPSGYIGGMALAFACGRGPKLGEEIENHMPIIAEDRLVHVGSRALDPPEVLAFSSSPAKLFTASQVKKSGATEVGKEAARHLENSSDWIVCHLDVDVVDPVLVPAVSYPTPGGLTVDEAAMIMRTLTRTGKVRVLELAAYNGLVDTGLRSAHAIIDLVGRIFT